jgi:hypothetical protein
VFDACPKTCHVARVKKNPAFTLLAALMLMLAFAGWFIAQPRLRTAPPAAAAPVERSVSADVVPLPSSSEATPALHLSPAAPAGSPARVVKAPSPPPLRPRTAAPAANSSSVASSKPALVDPAARAVLFMVGADADAEEYWRAAINDPSVPAAERQDLIEDLNEDGLSDPRHPTGDDLPLILSRLRLIEEASDEPLDETNADAFQEAFKDLVNLARVAAGGQLP